MHKGRNMHTHKKNQMYKTMHWLSSAYIYLVHFNQCETEHAHRSTTLHTRLWLCWWPCTCIQTVLCRLTGDASIKGLTGNSISTTPIISLVHHSLPSQKCQLGCWPQHPIASLMYHLPSDTIVECVKRRAGNRWAGSVLVLQSTNPWPQSNTGRRPAPSTQAGRDDTQENSGGNRRDRSWWEASRHRSRATKKSPLPEMTQT